MTITETAPSTTTPTTTPNPTPTTGAGPGPTTDRPAPGVARLARLGGIAGLVFAGSVLAQNVLRAEYPANDASATKVMAFYAEHRSLALVLAVLFPIGLAGIAGFVGALVTRVAHGGARVPAVAGLIGAAGIVGNFTMLLAADTAISGYVHRGTADRAVVEGFWVFHNAVFGVLLASIGIALRASRLRA